MSPWINPCFKDDLMLEMCFQHAARVGSSMCFFHVASAATVSGGTEVIITNRILESRDARASSCTSCKLS